MARRSQRNKRRGPVSNGDARPANGQPGQPTSAGGDRYQKFLPEWMKGANGAPVRPARPPRPRGSRPKRAAGGYTPGKAALGDVAFRDL